MQIIKSLKVHILFYLYGIYLCMCLCMFLCGPVCGGQSSTLDTFLSSSSSYCFKHRLPLKLELVDQQDKVVSEQWDALPRLPGANFTGMYHLDSFLYGRHGSCLTNGVSKSMSFKTSTYTASPQHRSRGGIVDLLLSSVPFLS